jgi:hypothetical protein
MYLIQPMRSALVAYRIPGKVRLKTAYLCGQRRTDAVQASIHDDEGLDRYNSHGYTSGGVNSKIIPPMAKMNPSNH